MIPTITELKPWLELLLVFWAAANTAAIWLRKPGVDAVDALKALRERIAVESAAQRAEVDARMRLGDERLTKIESDLRHVPTRDELRQLQGSVMQIDERTRGMAERIGALAQTAGRIETYLLTNKP